MLGLVSDVAHKIKQFLKRIRSSNCVDSAQKSNFDDQTVVGTTGPEPTPAKAPIIHETENTALPPRTSEHGSPVSPVLLQSNWISSHEHFGQLSNRAESPVNIPVPPRPPRKRAVLIGIQYHDEKDDSWPTLESPSGDIRKMERLLRKRGYNEFRILSDTHEAPINGHTYDLPSREKIWDALGWLVQDVKRDDRLFLYYSGHGEQVQGKDLAEKDGKDEAIVPLNCNGRYITDNELHVKVVEPIRVVPGSQLIVRVRIRLYWIAVTQSIGQQAIPIYSSGGITTRQHRPYRQPRSLDYMSRTGLWNGGVIQEDLSKLKRRSTLQSPMRLQSMVLPIPEGITGEPIQEEGVNEEQKRDVDIQKRKSTHASTHSNPARMAIFSTNQRPSTPASRGSTEHPHRTGQTVLQETTKTSSENIISNHITTLSTNPAGLPRVSNPIKSRVLSIGQFADGPDPNTGRVFAIAACQDEQSVFNIQDIGGLLTLHYVKYMKTMHEEKESTLAGLIDYLWIRKSFQQTVEGFHMDCRPEPCRNGTCTDEKCIARSKSTDSKSAASQFEQPLPGCGYHDCETPTEPPKPLVTSLTELNARTVIWP
ncbi:hypothetical protein CPB86DRAFT_796998 [Serendipita vermifera]|nr:hypothetical protein CPB86DRAFT_796998 [Serendipita vermifera]